jgi:TolB-like protein/DNA-binding winged helix-turn-helix (wHTH) protein/Flp pilus assembly protein TadD
MSSNGPQIFLNSAAGRSAEGAGGNLYEFDDFRLDARNRILLLGQDPVPLTAKALDTLLVLVKSEGRLVTKDDLMKAVWPDSVVEESNLTQTIFMLRKALGQTRDQGYIVTVPGRGYRFVADVKKVLSDGPVLVATVPAGRVAEIPIRRDRTLFRQWSALLAIALILVGAAGALLWFRSQSRPSPPLGRSMLAVLPFQNLTGDPTQDYFSDGLTEEMISQLGNLDTQHMGVIARTSVMHYKNTQTPLDQIGRELSVQYVVEGSVRRDSERVRISAQLIQMKDQSHIWARQYDRELRGLLTVQGEIAQEIADEIQLTLGEQRELNPKRAPVRSSAAPQSYEVYDLYLKGRYFWNKRTPEGFRQAAEYFQQAIDQDANYARAYAGLADTYGLMSTWGQVPPNEFMPKARSAALRALEIDETLAEAHTSLALVAENYDYDWQTADKEFRRAIQLDPSYATAHQWYAEYLSWQGRFEEALAESERARQLDPLSLIIATDHASILYFSRQYDRAIAQCRAVLDMDPNFNRVRGILLVADVQSGRFAEAMDETAHWTGQPDSTWAWGWRAYVYGRWGRASEAQHALAKFENLFPRYPNDPTQTLLLAYVGTGQKDRALALLQKGYATHSNIVATLNVDPGYDPLRSDPHFQQLLAQVFRSENAK